MAIETKVDLGRLSRRFFEHFDRNEIEELRAMMDVDVQGVDEISRTWMRGTASLDAYFAQLAEMQVADMTSILSDLHTVTWGDTGVATFVADQTYTAAGEPQRLTAPVTMVFRRRGADWRVAVIHAVALPEA